MLYIVIGLIGALLMFSGDMLLYYTPGDFDYESGDEVLQVVTNVMKNLPAKRVTIAGLIGPVAAFLYCIGFYHIVYMTDESWSIPAWIAFLASCMGIIAGGAYHTHCSYLGLLGADELKDAWKISTKYFSKIGFILYIGEGIGFLMLAVLIVTGHTLLPQWMFLLSPGILFLLKKPVRKLPKGIRAIVSGGWTNLISVIYYLAVLIFMLVSSSSL